MSPLQIIEKAKSLGISLFITDSHSLRFKGEYKSIDELMPLLKAHKAQIIQWLEFCDLYGCVAIQSGWAESDRKQWCKDLTEQPELTIECLRALKRSWDRGGYGSLTLDDWVEIETKNKSNAF